MVHSLFVFGLLIVDRCDQRSFPPRRGFEFNLKKFPAKTIIGDGQWAISKSAINRQEDWCNIRSKDDRV